MYIKTLALQNFRNHARRSLELSQGINVFVGDNAQGKTNLLEAIYVTCIGRGFRSPRDKDVIRFGQHFAKVKTIATKKFGDISIEVIINNPENTSRTLKQIKVNEIPILKMGELMGNVACVFFNPDELKLVKEAPADRRRFMDIDISQMDKTYFYNLLRYNKILKQRNALLKGIDTKNETEMRGLDIWDEQLATAGEQIIKRRIYFCEELNKLLPPVHTALAVDETVTLTYETNGGNMPGASKCSTATLLSPTDQGAPQDEHSEVPGMLAAVRSARANDLRLRTTTVGPHRDDILLQINGRDVRLFASQGQQRTVALSLKIAELKIFEQALGEKPILLLDDVFSELDAKRQEKLLKLISGWQTVITTTEFNLPLPNAKVFKISCVH
ncbi:MAG: DNA replication/repair protein RecF [Christensenellaceae bacterium]|nr:DNA replication/repair protein RecF [Christensenellaceae bacterium]